MAYARLDTSDAQRNLNWAAEAAGRMPCADPESDPLAVLRSLERWKAAGPGKWVGFLSYDLGRKFEDIGSTGNTRCDDLPLSAFLGCPLEPRNATSSSRQVLLNADVKDTRELQSDFSREEYLAAVQRCKDYISAGDVYQVNLAQRFTVPLTADPRLIYERLQQQAPAKYAAYLDFGDFQIISNSPELFLRVQPLPDGRRRVITRPIKGTRPRAPGMDIELRDSAKDHAELAMIVDLERNDLGRVCQIGSVKVIEPRVIEEHPTVYHGVATIEGILRDDVTLIDLLRATFPSGSVTGAPKIRAMQIIDELEPVRRGPYCGAIGYIAADGSMEFNVAIRTMIVKDGLVHIPVGGGIVADSDPEAEYEETVVKASAMFASLGIDASKDLQEMTD